MTDREWQDDWDRLVAERAAARKRWVGASEGFSAAVKDPFGVKTLVKRHPVIVSGVAAGLGAMLVRFFARPGAREGASEPPPANWQVAVRRAVMGAATPWLTGLLTRGLAGVFARRRRGSEDEEALASELNGRAGTSPRS